MYCFILSTQLWISLVSDMGNLLGLGRAKGARRDSADTIEIVRVATSFLRAEACPAPMLAK
jgi:hypothetical protein